MFVKHSGYQPYLDPSQCDRSNLAIADNSGLAELLREQAVSLLPPDLEDFTGRHVEVQQAIALWHQLQLEPETAPVLAIAGQPGIGKSAFALHLAHQLTQQTAAQLYFNVRRDRLISSTKIAQQIQNLPVSSDRPILVVLDNLDDQTLLDSLLALVHGCVFLVTSRHPVAVTTLELSALSEFNAIALLQTIARSKSISEEYETARSIIHCCDTIPLAIRLIGGLLQTHPHLELSDCLQQLQAERQRCKLSHLSYPAIRASFNLSYQTLDVRSRYLLRLLGLLPQPSLTLKTAAALSKTSILSTQKSIAHLSQLYILETSGKERYCLVDLLRLLVKSQLAIEESAESRQAARLRLIHAYQDAAKAVSSGLDASSRQQLTQIYGQDQEDFEQSLLVNAQNWFASERSNLLSAVEWAFQAEAWAIGLTLVKYLTSFLMLRGEWADLEAMLLNAIPIAQTLADDLQTAQLLNSLGNVYLHQGQWEKAKDSYQQSLEILHPLQKPIQESQTLANLGIIYWEQGDRDTAANLWSAALMQLPVGSSSDRNLTHWMQVTNAELLKTVLLQLEDRQQSRQFWGAIGRMVQRNYQLWMQKSPFHQQEFSFLLLISLQFMQSS
jgi:tetratricopeptide (TPR) repeat protein